MDQIDFHYVKLHNAIRAHQAVHSELQKNAHLDGPTRRRFCIRRRLYEQEIIKLLKQKQQQQLNERPQHKPGDTTETAAFSLPQSQSKRDSMGVLVPKAATTSKGSLFFSLPKQRGGSAAHLSYPSSSSSSSASSSSYPKAGGNGGVLVPKKIGGGLGTTTQFFIRRHRQTTPKKQKKGSSLATTSALSDDPALKRELAAIPHINTFDRGMFIEELLEGQERKKALKAELEQNKNTAGGAGESLEEEQDPSSSRGSNGSAALAPLSSSSSSAASSPTREAPLVVFTGILEADSATETPVSSACPSPVKVEKAKSITFEYNAAKDAFIRALDLVPREEYEELANKKNSRKRRTTANPQFSSAALEAKRQTKMEIIAERKNRRQQERAMKAQGGGKGGGGKGGGGTGKDFSKLLPQGSMKAADQEESQDGLLPTRGNSLAPSSSSSSSNSNLAPIIIISKPGGKKPLFSDNKSKSNFKIENRQVFPGLYLVKRITRGNYTCKLCGELVQCTLDTVLVCKRCSVFFHLNCATPFAKVGGQVGCDELACPGCGASSEDDDEQQQKQKQKQKQQLPNIKEIKEEKGEGDEEEMTPRDLLGRLHDLHQYIHSLNHANQVLGSLCLQRENEANQLRREVAQYEGVWETMNKVLGEKLFSTCQ